MKILLVSDEESKFIWDYFDREVFQGVELVISCGDLDSRYLSFIATMLPVPVIYIHGNHDKSYSRHPPEGCISIEDQLVVYKGIRFLGFGGCLGVHGAEMQEFTEKQMEKRISRRKFDLIRNKGFDVLVTHAPAYGLGDRDDAFHRGFPAFHALIDKYNPKYHFYGHVHTYGKDHSAPFTQNGTTFVNACGYRIMDINV